MTQALPIPTFVINLDRDVSRRALMLEQFEALAGFDVRMVTGTHGPSLPDAVCAALVQNVAWSSFKGTIGCFLSHVKAWEEVAKLESGFGVILEDDVTVRGLDQLAGLDLPADLDIVFLNDRMCPGRDTGQELGILPLWQALLHLDVLRSGGPGGDGYLLTMRGAKELLAACRSDLFFGHVDGRLLRYATNEADLAKLSSDTWIGDVVRRHHHPTLSPKLGLLRGACLSRPLVSHRGMPSSREANDTVSPAQATERTPNAKCTSTPQIPPKPMLPIRYWNRISNIGDLINPHIIETISGRRPTYATDPAQEHVLGIGSIFFMANAQSHIWGSGMLDPSADYSAIDLHKVHAVRGKLTRRVLQDRYGFDLDVPLGDPGIFVDELSEIKDAIATTPIRRRVALIPHYAMVGHEEILRLAREMDADILNPRTASLDFLKDIIASEVVVSQSLHGLIFAEIFGKPSTWIAHDHTDLWQFKFRDWFSNTAEPPKMPLPLHVLGAMALAEVRLSTLAIDREALRSAFPRFEARTRPACIGYRESRARPPLVLRITPDPRLPSQSDFDATLFCETGNEGMLRDVLNAVSRRYDDSPPGFLVFDPQGLGKLSVARMRQYLDRLTDFPDIHFLGLPGGADAKTPNGGPAPARWNPDQNWKTTILIRTLQNFSFSAPGRIVSDI